MNIDEGKKAIAKLIQEDKYPEALKRVSALIKDYPSDLELSETFLFLYNRINEGNEDLIPESAEEFINRGLAKLHSGDLEKSISDYSKALNIDPLSDLALAGRSFSYSLLAKYAEALSDLEKAIRINPIGKYFDDLSRIYDFIDDKEKMLINHKKAVELAPDDARLWYNFGVSLMELGNYTEALLKYEHAIELWPQYPDAIQNRNYVKSILNKS